MYLKLLALITLISMIVGYFFLPKSSAQSETLIPRHVLFGNPDKRSVTLSPNAEYLSYLAPSNGVLNVWVAPRKDITAAKVITDDNSRGIRSYVWLYDNEHLLYLQDNKGDENFRVYSKNIHTNITKLLTPENGVKASISGISHKFPNEVIISSNERDKKYFDLYRYNLATGSKELILENTKYDQIIIDNDFKVRFASLKTEEGNTEYFKFENGNWSPYMEVSLEDSENTGFNGFDKTGNILYLSDSRERDTAALKAIDLRTGESTILASDDKSDVSIFTSHPTEDSIQAVSTNYEKVKYSILDNAIKDDMAYLETLDEGELIINSRSLDDQYWIVVTHNDNAPVKYYEYDRANKKANFLFSNKKDLEQYQLAKMHPVIIKSRDDLNLVSYITYPANTKLNEHLQPQQPLPMVLFVHGGPWSRDDWGFSPVHQLLANRGYAVLSVNFRGSTGFGKKFTNAGNMQWGKKMHDDLIDAVNWSIDNKIALPNKIAIMGGSYGGYATLAGLTLTPDIFACGVDIVGPSNLVTLLKNFPAYWAPFMNVIKKQVGDWNTEEGRKALLEVSPISFVDKIKKPLLIGQGAHDPRVLQSESDQIATEMNKKNIPVLYALYQDEGHGFARPENRISFFALAEQFLAKVLGGRYEPMGEDLKGSNFSLNGIVPKDSAEIENSVNKAIAR